MASGVLSRAAVALCLVIAAGGAAAAPATRLTFLGAVSSLSSGYAVPGIEVGDAVSGSLDYDPGGTDTQPLGWVGLYSGAITRFSAQIGDQVFSMVTSPPPSEIVVINDDLVSGLYRDSLYFRVAVEDAALPGVRRFLQLTFSVGAAARPAVLLDDTLPGDFDPQGFSVRSGFVTYFPPGASQGSNIILSDVDVAPVPEPAAVAMLLAGLAWVLCAAAPVRAAAFRMFRRR